jgi:hypothetical protein
MTETIVTNKTMIIDPETFQPLVSVTIHLPIEALQDSVHISENDLALAIGTDILNALKPSKTENED